MHKPAMLQQANKIVNCTMLAKRLAAELHRRQHADHGGHRNMQTFSVQLYSHHAGKAGDNMQIMVVMQHASWQSGVPLSCIGDSMQNMVAITTCRYLVYSCAAVTYHEASCRNLVLKLQSQGMQLAHCVLQASCNFHKTYKAM